MTTVLRAAARAAAVASCLTGIVFMAASPAYAQYGGGGGGGGGAIHNPQATASVSDATLCPGQSFTITTSPGSFAEGASVTIWLLRLVPGASPVTLGAANADNLGRVTATVAIPSGAATSNYVVYLEGPAIPGGVRVLAAAVVVNAAFPGCSSPQSVRRPATAAAGSGPAPSGPPAGLARPVSVGGPHPGAPADVRGFPARSALATNDGGFAGRAGAGGLAAAALVCGLAFVRAGRRRARTGVAR